MPGYVIFCNQNVPITLSQYEDLPWVTLVTCRDYDEKTGTYKRRLVVRAVQIKVE